MLIRSHSMVRLPARPARLALAALALIVPVLLTGSAAATDSVSVPRPSIVIARPGHCIEPAESMLRDHPDLLRHQRDITVHSGTRGARVSLRSCVECHANPITHSVIGSSQAFCQGCHEYAAVHPDCFECHSPRATGAQPTAGVPHE
jgi:[DsrC]-trisulfide reductase subunit J